MGRRPATYPLLKYLPRSENDWLVGRRTDVCIEGYPRSGNSVSVRAFEEWNPGLTIAHHLHVPMQVVRAVEFGVPTAVLIRAPLDAVASHFIFFAGQVSINTLLRTYAEFYEDIYPLLDQIAICEFQSLVSDPRRLPEALNEKFGSGFTAGNWNVEVEQNIHEQVKDSHNTTRTGLASRLPLPSATRAKDKRKVKPTIEASRDYDRARSIYHRLAPLG
jgi:hypothetical protein